MFKIAKLIEVLAVFAWHVWGLYFLMFSYERPGVALFHRNISGAVKSSSFCLRKVKCFLMKYHHDSYENKKIMRALVILIFFLTCNVLNRFHAIGGRGGSSYHKWLSRGMPLMWLHRKPQVSHLTHLSYSESLHGQNDSPLTDFWVILNDSHRVSPFFSSFFVQNWYGTGVSHSFCKLSQSNYPELVPCFS